MKVNWVKVIDENGPWPDEDVEDVFVQDEHGYIDIQSWNIFSNEFIDAGKDVVAWAPIEMPEPYSEQG